MNLSGPGVPVQPAEITRDEVSTGGRLLSVTEIQQALRTLRACRSCDVAQLLDRDREQAGVSSFGGGAAPPGTGLPIGLKLSTCRGEARCVQHGGGQQERWVGVVAAHAGAGASTVALAIADAAAAVGRITHLIETAHPSRSGLVAAARAELGVDPGGGWRRGSRGRVILHRRADDEIPASWPALPGSQDGLVVIDLGLPAPDCVSRLGAGQRRTVVVYRPTVPGARLAEQLLNSIPGSVIAASVGPGRWPARAAASTGPRLPALLASNAMVTVPTDRRLEITGPTSSALPKPVAAAGRSLLALIDATHSGEATVPTLSAPRSKGTDR
jgi:hypothetical protein